MNRHARKRRRTALNLPIPSGCSERHRETESEPIYRATLYSLRITRYYSHHQRFVISGGKAPDSISAIKSCSAFLA